MMTVGASMQTRTKTLFVDGNWAEPDEGGSFTLIDPSTEAQMARVSLGSAADVDRAVGAARRAFATFGRSSVQYRSDLLTRISEVFTARSEELVSTLSMELGAPLTYAREFHVPHAGLHFKNARDVLTSYQWETAVGGALHVREPIGVCGLITAWNWPLMLITSKLAYAIAAGCTVVLKPSEYTPFSAILLMEVLEEAGVPPGVVNLVVGDGQSVGNAIAAHPDIDMVTFTGSTRAGVHVAQSAAPSVKRVHLELGGKSPNIILPDADLDLAIPKGVLRAFVNSGQACIAPTRMFVPRELSDRVAELAKQTAESIVTGAPGGDGVQLGPLINQAQFDRVQSYIESGIDEGATLVAGGLGRPSGLDRGYFVKPTVFADVAHEMRISQEEIFGPVLSIINYDTVEQAIEMANDSPYGLGAYVHSGDMARAREVATQLRAGRVYINLAASDTVNPFGGYEQSGNGRENGVHGFEEYLELKAILGYESNSNPEQ